MFWFSSINEFVYLPILADSIHPARIKSDTEWKIIHICAFCMLIFLCFARSRILDSNMDIINRDLNIVDDHLSITNL